MAVKYNGLLRFTDEIKAEIDLAADGTVEKAVIIDGDGVETPIGGGGSSDFTTAEVTLVNSGDTSKAVMVPVLSEARLPFEPNATIRGALTSMANETTVINVPLYKGHCLIKTGTPGDLIDGQTVATSFTVTSGSATSSIDGVDITGDCTITISAS